VAQTLILSGSSRYLCKLLLETRIAEIVVISVD